MLLRRIKVCKKEKCIFKFAGVRNAAPARTTRIRRARARGRGGKYRSVVLPPRPPPHRPVHRNPLPSRRTFRAPSAPVRLYARAPTTYRAYTVHDVRYYRSVRGGRWAWPGRPYLIAVSRCPGAAVGAAAARRSRGTRARNDRRVPSIGSPPRQAPPTCAIAVRVARTVAAAAATTATVTAADADADAAPRQSARTDRPGTIDARACVFCFHTVGVLPVGCAFVRSFVRSSVGWFHNTGEQTHRSR